MSEREWESERVEPTRRKETLCWWLGARETRAIVPGRGASPGQRSDRRETRETRAKACLLLVSVSVGSKEETVPGARCQELMQLVVVMPGRLLLTPATTGQSSLGQAMKKHFQWLSHAAQHYHCPLKVRLWSVPKEVPIEKSLESWPFLIPGHTIGACPTCPSTSAPFMQLKPLWFLK